MYTLIAEVKTNKGVYEVPILSMEKELSLLKKQHIAKYIKECFNADVIDNDITLSSSTDFDKTYGMDIQN